MFGALSGKGYEGCYPLTATEVAFTTTCYDYPTTWTGLGTEPAHDIGRCYIKTHNYYIETLLLMPFTMNIAVVSVE